MLSSFWTAIAVIAIVAILSNMVIKIVTANKGSGAASQRVDQLEQTVDDLSADLVDARSRIEVLEKIVTDQRYDLGREIDDLASR